MRPGTGRAAIARWLDRVFAGRSFRLFPTLANGGPRSPSTKSGGACLPGEAAHEAFEPHCIQLVWLGRARVARIISFLNLDWSRGSGSFPPAAVLQH
jgi:hypothetical protein